MVLCGSHFAKPVVCGTVCMACAMPHGCAPGTIAVSDAVRLEDAGRSEATVVPGVRSKHQLINKMKMPADDRHFRVRSDWEGLAQRPNSPLSSVPPDTS